MKIDYAHYHEKIVVDGIASRVTFITSRKIVNKYKVIHWKR